MATTTTKIKAPIESAQDVRDSFQRVHLESGEMATSLVPDLNAPISKVIISESVLEMLIDNLPKASVRKIAERFIEELKHRIAEGRTELTMEEYADMLRTELSFQESINLVKRYFHLDQDTQNSFKAGY